MYPHLEIWKPVAAMATLVATAVLATSTITVDPGETLSEIAVRNDVTVAQLVAWNDIDDPDRIYSGSTLVVAAPDGTPGTVADRDVHVVTAGDTLSAIASRLGTTVARLAAANSLADPDRIRVGQRLVVAAGSDAAATTTTSSIAAARTHIVAPGETLSEIAASYGIKTGVLARDNGIDDPDRIVEGMSLVIAGAAPASEPAAPPAPAATPTTTPTPAPTPAAPAPATPSRVGDVLLVPLFARWSGVYNVPQELLEAIAWVESDWHPEAVGSDGGLGITQLDPETVALIEGGLLGRDLNPLDASEGIQMGARYLRYLLDRTDGEREAIAAWTQGLAGVQRDGVTAAGSAYVDQVEEIRRLRG